MPQTFPPTGFARKKHAISKGKAPKVRYIVYDDRAAVDHHMQTDYMIAYREETMPLISERTLTMAVMANE